MSHRTKGPTKPINVNKFTFMHSLFSNWCKFTRLGDRHSPFGSVTSGTSYVISVNPNPWQIHPMSFLPSLSSEDLHHYHRVVTHSVEVRSHFDVLI